MSSMRIEGTSCLVLGMGAALAPLVVWFLHKRSANERVELPVKKHQGYSALIGNTPLVTLRSLSEITGRTISVKCEYLNPGGTGKDRIALSMIEEAESQGLLKPGGTVVEGTSGSTGIALAAICASKGYRCIVVMPDDQAEEKRELLRRFGAEVTTVKTAAIANPGHYVNVARRMAAEIPGGVFMDQVMSGVVLVLIHPSCCRGFGLHACCLVHLCAHLCCETPAPLSLRPLHHHSPTFVITIATTITLLPPCWSSLKTWPTRALTMRGLGPSFGSRLAGSLGPLSCLQELAALWLGYRATSKKGRRRVCPTMFGWCSRILLAARCSTL